MFTNFGNNVSLEQLEKACAKQKEIIDQVYLVNHLRRNKAVKDVDYFDTFFRTPYVTQAPKTPETPK